MRRRGIILAGGAGTRLHPVTMAVSKQLVPVYDKPMVYYPLSTLMLAGIREYPVDYNAAGPGGFPGPARRRQRNGDSSIDYAAQPGPEGIAQAFLIGADFIGRRPMALILGDNIFYGQSLSFILQLRATRRCRGNDFRLLRQ